MKSDGSIFTLENEELLITVESHGAQLSRIHEKKRTEVLWALTRSLEPSLTNSFSIYWKIGRWKIPL